ncbi:dolichyl-diphosphooligosaccharide--protein glycosyltransferase subunit 1 [Coemansia sp. RSA 2336]|nr:dolichyl-diphosphooligosaccharide--protein glycosyltransferase subunit 1 [Coemansia sp. RSA 2336]
MPPALLLLLGLVLALTAQAASSGLVLTNLIRTVDLTALPAVSEQIGVVLQNTHDSKVAKSYVVQVPSAKLAHLSQVSVRERKSGARLQVAQTTESGYQATFNRPLQPGDKLSLNIDLVFLNTVRAQPAAVEQSHDQTWTWSDRVLVESADPVNKQKTVVKVPGAIKSYSQLNATSQKGKSVTFGPFAGDSADVAGGQEAYVRFLDNSEQLEALEHRREYFVSHWANDLNVLEHYALRNRAPALLGGFDKVKQTVSRFMKARDNFIKTLLVKVPVDARQMYVVDEIGNVSTSAVSRPQRVDGEEFKLMQLKPRYPMAGQWNYTWWHGYSVPLSNYLRVRGTRHALQVPFIGSLTGSASQSNEIPVAATKARNTAVSRYQLRITLPEGATNINTHVPAAVDAVRMEKHHYYFDVQGRTVVVIEHRNVAPSLADEHVVVVYDYSRWALWQKPVVVGLVLFVLFAGASLVNRMQHGLTSSVVSRSKKSQ